MNCDHRHHQTFVLVCNPAYLVDVSLRVREVPDESPGAKKCAKDTKAYDVGARVVPRGSVEVGVVLEALAIVRLRKRPLALLLAAAALVPRGVRRDLVEAGHGCARAVSRNQFDGHGQGRCK